MALLTGGGISASTLEDTQSQHITIEKNNFGVDYYPYHESAVILPTGGGVISNLPVDTVTFPTTGGGVSPTFKQDFYYRIHITPSTLDLGNILSFQTKTVEVWNSYFVSDTITAINEVTLPDVTLTTSLTFPYTFKPLESQIMTISIESTGVAQISGNYTFAFSAESPTLTITGDRVAIWPHLPDRNFTETKQWLTSVIKAKTGEQREKIREVPRISLQTKYRFKSQKEYVAAKTQANATAQLKLGLPLWTDWVKINNIPAGTQTLSFDNSELEIEVGSTLILWESYDKFEAVEVESMTSSSVTFINPTEQERNNCYLAPIKMGYATKGIRFTLRENNRYFANVNIIDTAPFVSENWVSETYLGLRILKTIPVISGSLSSGYIRSQETIDNSTGDIVKVDKESYNRGKYTITFTARNRTELYNLRRQIDAIQGKYFTFWLPSFMTDMININPVLAGNNSIKVIQNNWDKYSPQHIRIIGDIEQSVQVTSATDNGDGTASIAITPIITSDINNVKSIQFMTKVRFDSDIIEFLHSNGITKVRIPVIEVVA